MSALDSAEFERIIDEFKKDNTLLSKEMNELAEEYLLLSTMSRLYFGPKTKLCFDKLSNMANDKDGFLLNYSREITPCRVFWPIPPKW